MTHFSRFPMAEMLSIAARTDGQAILVMHRGRIVYERSISGGSAAKPMMLASGSKSFVDVGTIAAVADGLLQLDAPVAELRPAWICDSRKSRVTVRQLLSLESGIETGNPGTGDDGKPQLAGGAACTEVRVFFRLRW